jgi:hypothetical protein
MALISSGNIISTTSATSLELKAEANESFRVTDIHILGQASAYATIIVDGKNQGYIRCDAGATTLGNMIPFIPTNSRMKTILGLLYDKGIFKGYPVATGTKIIVKVPTTATVIAMVYDKYDAGEVKSSEQGGKDSSEQIVLNYGTVAATVSTATETQLTVKSNPADFPDFPFKDTAPSKRKVEILGVCASARAYTLSSGNDIFTSYLKMVSKEGTIFDEKNLVGMMCRAVPSTSSTTFIAEAGYDICGENSLLYQKEPLIFKTPLVFESGEDFDTFWGTEMTGTGTRVLTAAQLEICYIMRITKTGD